MVIFGPCPLMGPHTWGLLFMGPLFGRTCWTSLNPPLHWRLWLWVKVLRLTRHKIYHFEDVLFSQSLSWYCDEEINLTQQKQTFIRNGKKYRNAKWTQKLKPGLVASYDLRPGNGAGRVLHSSRVSHGAAAEAENASGVDSTLWNCSGLLTCLLTYLLT